MHPLTTNSFLQTYDVYGFGFESADSLADGEGNPTEAQIRLYERWAEGGTAVSFIGGVQGDPRFPEKPGNLVLGAHSNQNLLQLFTSRAVIEGAH